MSTKSNAWWANSPNIEVLDMEHKVAVEVGVKFKCAQCTGCKNSKES